MVAVASKDIEAFVKTGFSRFSLVLFYGPDEGLVSERAAMIARATVDRDADNIMRLDGDEIANDPLKLVDEANAISMFGGVRALRIRTGSKSIAQALETLLATPPIDARIIIEAGDIKPTHYLRKLFDKTSVGAAVACYAEEVRDTGRLLDTLLQEAGFSISSDAKQTLLQSVGADRKRSRSEIEKLFLYCHGQKQITLEDVEAVITDAASLSTDAVIDAAFSGQLETIETEARRLFADGVDPGVLMGFALRHSFLLQNIRAMQGDDRNASESMKRNGVNWKRERAVSDHISRWTDARLTRAVQIIGDAVFNIRKHAALGEATAIRALWSLGLSVRR
ncbi:MAG: DNA polymerase III subunit delta [Beijerinckiaceae bacterium]